MNRYKFKQFIYSCILLTTFMPTVAVKTFYCQPDTQYHQLYPNDDERAHREAAKALNDNLLFNYHLSIVVLSDECSVPKPTCLIRHEHRYDRILRVVATHCHCFLRAPPAIRYC